MTSSSSTPRGCTSTFVTLASISCTSAMTWSLLDDVEAGKQRLRGSPARSHLLSVATGHRAWACCGTRCVGQGTIGAPLDLLDLSGPMARSLGRGNENPVARELLEKRRRPSEAGGQHVRPGCRRSSKSSPTTTPPSPDSASSWQPATTTSAVRLIGTSKPAEAEAEFRTAVALQKPDRPPSGDFRPTTGGARLAVAELGTNNQQYRASVPSRLAAPGRS